MTETNTTLKIYQKRFPHYQNFFELLQKVFLLRQENESLWTKDIFPLNQTETEQRISAGKPLINLQLDPFDDKPPKRYFLNLLTIAEPEHPALANEIRETIANHEQAYAEMVRALFTPAENPKTAEDSFALIPFFIQESLKPFFSHLALKQKEVLTRNLWQQGLCPVCSRPADLSLLRDEEGKRSLFCRQCNFEWPYKRLQCPFCKNEDQSKLDYFTIDDPAQKHYRVNVCHQCRRFIKTIDFRAVDYEINLEIETLITIHLDLKAAAEDFH